MGISPEEGPPFSDYVPLRRPKRRQKELKWRPTATGSTRDTATDAADTFIEEGDAFRTLFRRGTAPADTPPAGPQPERERAPVERFDVVVIGAGQAGLSVGRQLARRGLRFVILDAAERVGDVWRARWDSLRLFTPARFDGLDGLPFPGTRNLFPTKDQMADYLESYAAHFHLPVRTNVRVDKLAKSDGIFRLTTRDYDLEADNVVVAMASYQGPRIPSFARLLRPDIVQLHSRDYRNPAQLRDGDVLIVGAGNSGAEIAIDVARNRRVWMSGRDTGHVPFRVDGLPARFFLTWLVLRVLFHRVLTVRTLPGRKARPKAMSQGTPLIRLKPGQLTAAGITRVPRTVGERRGLPVLADGQVMDVANVIWCTGFSAGFSWIDLPIFDADGEPRHESGVCSEQPGLYFVGLHFLHAFSSTMIHGVGRDADRIVQAIARARRGQAAGRTDGAPPHSRSHRARASERRP